MTYEQLSHFAGTWGLLMLLALFAITIGYALWPGNRSKFDRAARAVLNDDTEKRT